MLITTWHGEPTEYARITLHNTTTSNANAPYRQRCSSSPTRTGPPRRCSSHAGGAAWIENYLYVASTNRLLVFRMSDLIKVKPARRSEVRTYDYILPQAGSYTANANPGLRFSAVSLDRSQSRVALVTSEFRTNATGGRIVRFPVNANGSTGATVKSLSAFKTSGITNIQGALACGGGRFAIATSYSSAPSPAVRGAATPR